MRFRINVVLPLPRKPVMIVTGVGAIFKPALVLLRGIENDE